MALQARRGRGVLAAALLAVPLAGWGPPTQLGIARAASKLAPADLARQIERRAAKFDEGVLAPFSEGAPERHYRNRDRGALDRAVAEETAAALVALRDLAPFDEVVYRLGRVAHFVADANNPLNAAGDDDAEARYFADWLRYAEAARPRFAAVFYAGEPRVGDEREMRDMVLRALQRGRTMYPRVGDEYRRIGYGRGATQFDDRSTAFGVAAVSYSHAISDLARALRYVWIAGGGADPREQLWAAAPSDISLAAGRKLLLLPRSGGGQ